MIQHYKSFLYFLLLFGDNVSVRMEACPKQSGVDDCGVFVIAVCVGLATTGQLPQSFTRENEVSHAGMS